MSTLLNTCINHALNIVDGNKVIEVRIPGVDKGTATQKWLNKRAWDFALAVGDDKTDEDMFAVMPPEGFSIKVGLQASKARLRARNSAQVKLLLGRMTNAVRDEHKLRLLITNKPGSTKNIAGMYQ
jgi:trehalose 6-phosphate synthase/phosphatase